ncbi:cellulose biosynthesis protein BcsE [Spongiibacter taiwanensis]|uniref:cellulose biosynthesis protein BcsE n=1 Tax=Spongiibacter taiwanensis TaxID=1748242 RepID=UPI002034B001|nr:cellulose biosynthesis protein BcsE [Spongiibacter taiwanensis]USA42927.1 cellulose biosynthesis protein BcsE [Spongiibacter taiwanensis]
MSGILALPKESAKLRQGEMYLCFAQSTSDIALLLQNIWHDDNPGVLICSYTQEFLFQSLSPGLHNRLHGQLSKAPHHVHFWRPKKSRPMRANLNRILVDAKRLHLPRGTRVTVSLQDNTIGRASSQNLRRKLSAWQRWASEEALRLQVLIHGDAALLRPAVMQHNDLFAGVSSLQRLSECHYHYTIQYWRGPQSVVASEEYSLIIGEDGRLGVNNHVETKTGAPELTQPKNYGDEQCIYACREALYDAGSVDSIEKDFARIVPSNAALIEQIEIADAATFVFSCGTTDEVRDLAGAIYVLRKRFGGGVKLLVRETRDCLRYSDEQFLCRAGANLVIPYNLVFSVFMNQLEALQGQYFGRQLPATLEALMDNWPYRGLQGYFEPADFARHGMEIIDDSSQNDIDDLLVQLRPAKGIPAEHCLSLCTIRRDGDLITTADDDLFMLLPACRLNDVKAALHSCFALPAEEIFASQQVYHTRNDIEAQFVSLMAAQHFVPADWGRRMLREAPNTQPEDASNLFEDSLSLAKPAPLQIRV